MKKTKQNKEEWDLLHLPAWQKLKRAININWTYETEKEEILLYTIDTIKNWLKTDSAFWSACWKCIAILKVPTLTQQFHF